MTVPPGPFVRNVSLDTHIFRTFRRSHLRQAFEEGTIALVRPYLWDDPFEDIVSRCGIVDHSTIPHTQTFLGNFRLPVYAQCWSLAAESDALWRIYSTVIKDPATGLNAQPEAEGIKVRTSAKKLLEALSSNVPQEEKVRCFIGKVTYLPKDQALQAVVNEIARNREKTYASVEGHANSLMTKISAYEHETEIRLIFVGQLSAGPVPDILPIRVDPNDLFDEMELDPRLSYHEAEIRQKELVELGYRGKVTRSDLYQKTLYQIPINYTVA